MGSLVAEQQTLDQREYMGILICSPDHMMWHKRPSLSARRTPTAWEVIAIRVSNPLYVLPSQWFMYKKQAVNTFLIHSDQARKDT